MGEIRAETAERVQDFESDGQILMPRLPRRLHALAPTATRSVLASPSLSRLGSIGKRFTGGETHEEARRATRGRRPARRSPGCLRRQRKRSVQLAWRQRTRKFRLERSNPSTAVAICAGPPALAWERLSWRTGALLGRGVRVQPPAGAPAATKVASSLNLSRL